MVEREEREHHFLHKRLYKKLRSMQSNQVAIVTIRQRKTLEASPGRAAFRELLAATRCEEETELDSEMI